MFGAKCIRALRCTSVPVKIQYMTCVIANLTVSFTSSRKRRLCLSTPSLSAVHSVTLTNRNWAIASEPSTSTLSSVKTTTEFLAWQAASPLQHAGRTAPGSQLAAGACRGVPRRQCAYGGAAACVASGGASLPVLRPCCRHAAGQAQKLRLPTLIRDLSRTFCSFQGHHLVTAEQSLAAQKLARELQLCLVCSRVCRLCCWSPSYDELVTVRAHRL